MGFSRQEYWNGLPFLSPGDLPYPGVPCIESEVMKSLSHVQLFAIPWTVVYQASLSMGFSRQEYWSGLPFPSPGDLPDPRIEPRSPALQADALPSEPPGKQILYQLSYQGSPSRYLPREVKNTTCKDLYINDYNTFISGSKKMGEKSKHPTTRVKGK